MDAIEAGCLIQRVSDTEYILRPRTSVDKNLLASFVDPQKGRYVNVRVMNRAQAKTYDQTKTFWALLSLYYRAFIGSTPTSKELEWFYNELLKDLFPVRKSITKEGQFEPKHWSELTKAEGIEVINKMVVLVSEQNHVPESVQASVRDIFEWLQCEKNNLYKDPCDYHEDGTPLNKDEWAERNQICMVTGIMGGDICHIVSKELGKGYDWLINLSWNFYRASHEIHLNIQHSMGWKVLFNGKPDYIMSDGKPFMGAPWLRPRYERAMRLFNEGKRLSNEGYTPEEIIAHLSYSESADNDKPIQHTYSAKSLAEQAASEEMDIF